MLSEARHVCFGLLIRYTFKSCEPVQRNFKVVDMPVMYRDEIEEAEEAQGWRKIASENSTAYFYSDTMEAYSDGESEAIGRRLRRRRIVQGIADLLFLAAAAAIFLTVPARAWRVLWLLAAGFVLCSLFILTSLDFEKRRTKAQTAGYLLAGALLGSILAALLELAYSLVRAAAGLFW